MSQNIIHTSNYDINEIGHNFDLTKFFDNFKEIIDTANLSYELIHDLLNHNINQDNIYNILEICEFLQYKHMNELCFIIFKKILYNEIRIDYTNIKNYNLINLININNKKNKLFIQICILEGLIDSKIVYKTYPYIINNKCLVNGKCNCNIELTNFVLNGVCCYEYLKKQNKLSELCTIYPYGYQQIYQKYTENPNINEMHLLNICCLNNKNNNIILNLLHSYDCINIFTLQYVCFSNNYKVIKLILKYYKKKYIILSSKIFDFGAADMTVKTIKYLLSHNYIFDNNEYEKIYNKRGYKVNLLYDMWNYIDVEFQREREIEYEYIKCEILLNHNIKFTKKFYDNLDIKFKKLFNNYPYLCINE